MVTEQFIERAKKVHGDKYDYSKVEYKNNHTKVCIICPIHGEFWMTPNNHLQGHGCKPCGYNKNAENQTLSLEQFIEKAKKIHGEKYDYSKVKYFGMHTRICIICPKHGEFWQLPYDHLQGKGCKKCGYESNCLTNEQFIEKAKKIHGEKYDYSKIIYKDNNTPVCIICKEHGEFWQTPHTHLKGYGCNKCSETTLENKCRLLLEKNHIEYISQKKFDWLGNQRLDFYLPNHNIGIECQGEQHYRPIEFFGGLKTFNKIKNNDIKKSNKCKENKIKLIYFSEERHNSFNGVKSYYDNNILKELISYD